MELAPGVSFLRWAISSKTAQRQVISSASDVGLRWPAVETLGFPQFGGNPQVLAESPTIPTLSLMDSLATAVPIAQTSNSPLPLALVVRDDR